MGALTDRMKEALEVQRARVALSEREVELLGEAVALGDAAARTASAPQPATFAPPGGGTQQQGLDTVGTGAGGGAAAGAGTGRQIIAPPELITGDQGTRMTREQLDRDCRRVEVDGVVRHYCPWGEMFSQGLTPLGTLAARSSGGTATPGADRARAQRRIDEGTYTSNFRGFLQRNLDERSGSAPQGSASAAQAAQAVGSAVGAAVARAVVGVQREQAAATAQLARAVEALRRPDTLQARASGSW